MSNDLSNKELLEAINEGFNTLEDKMATKDDLESVESKMATKDELADVKSEMATKDDLAETEEKIMEEMNKRFDDVDTQLDQIAEFVKDHTSRLNALEEADEEGAVV